MYPGFFGTDCPCIAKYIYPRQKCSDLDDRLHGHLSCYPFALYHKAPWEMETDKANINISLKHLIVTVSDSALSASCVLSLLIFLLIL
jgi:hypothetical protein